MSCCGNKNDVGGQVSKSNVSHNKVMAKKFYGAN